MLEVVPIQTKTEQEAECARCGVPYNADLMAYHALIDGELTGVCQFTMNREGGFIRDLAVVQGRTLNERDRIESLYVLGRATLNFIDLCGVHKAWFEDADFARDHAGLVESIGFDRQPDGRWFVDLTDFFIEPCKHHKGCPTHE